MFIFRAAGRNLLISRALDLYKIVSRNWHKVKVNRVVSILFFLFLGQFDNFDEIYIEEISKKLKKLRNPARLSIFNEKKKKLIEHEQIKVIKELNENKTGRKFVAVHF